MPVGRHRKFKAKEVVRAVLESGGVLLRAAEILGCERRTIAAYRDRYPTVREALDQAWEANVDEAEIGLLDQMRSGQQWAVNKILSEKGRARGWGKPSGSQDDPEHQVLEVRWLDD